MIAYPRTFVFFIFTGLPKNVLQTGSGLGTFHDHKIHGHEKGVFQSIGEINREKQFQFR